MSEILPVFRVEHFEDHLRFERGLSERTVEGYRRDLLRFLVQLAAVPGPPQHPAAVTSAHLAAHVVALREAGLAATSIRRAQSALRTYFSFLVAEGVVEDDPAARLESPRIGRPLPVVLSRAEVERLLETPDPEGALYWRDLAILELLYATGMRVSELVGLTIQDLDLEEGYSTVFGKGGKERIIPVGGAALRAVRRYLAEVRPGLAAGRGTDALFLSARGNPLSRMTVWRLVRSACERAGIERRVGPHTLRHTFATHLLEAGADLAVVQELLGHADISTTQIYTHVDREYLRAVHRRHHPRG